MVTKFSKGGLYPEPPGSATWKPHVEVIKKSTIFLKTFGIEKGRTKENNLSI